MVDIVTSGHIDHIWLADLKPGQLGRVVANGGLEGNGKHVIGVSREESNRFVNARSGANALAVVVETGVLLYNENTLVSPYSDRVYLKLDQYQHMTSEIET